MRDLKISTLLSLGFGAMALLIAALGTVAFVLTGGISERVVYIVDNRFPVVVEMKKLTDEANLQARALRNIALLSKAEDIRKEVEAIDASRAHAKEIYAQLDTQIVSAKGKELLRRMQEGRARYLAGSEKFMAAVRAGQRDEAVAQLFSELRPAQLDYIKAIDEMSDLQVGFMTEAGQSAKTSATEVRTAVLGIAAVALAVAAAMGLWITRAISRPLGRAVGVARAVSQGDLATPVEATGSNETAQLLAALRDMQGNLVQVVSRVRENSESVAMASSQIAQGNLELSSRTEEQASALEESAASMEQLSSTVRQNADNARQANQLAMDASSVALKGGEVVSDVVETMKGINESSRRIAEIIGVIDGIAFQTNILALNAAVEAARAGEQGRGFAVVAGEVRSLAHRSAEAAREIKTLIGASVDRVEQGTALVDRAGATMTEVVHSIRRVTDIMGEISAASSEQSAGVAQVGEAVSQMDRATQQNAALVEESAAAAESLKAQADELVKAVAVFRLGHEAGAARLQRPPARPEAAAPVAPRVSAKPAAAPRPSGTPTPSGPVAAAHKPAALRPAAPPAAAPAEASDWESF